MNRTANSSTSESPGWNDALLTNPHEVADKRQRVRNMFAAIAPSYDLNNRLHSLWQDQRWRRKAVKLAQLKATDRVVDVACGTGDLSIEFMRGLMRLAKAARITRARRDEREHWSVADERVPPSVIGIDFTYEMLPIAAGKAPSVHTFGADETGLWDGRAKSFIWFNGDAQALP